MASGATIRARGQTTPVVGRTSGGLSYNGTDLTPPAPIKSQPIVAGNIQSAISSAQTGQDQANAANSQRYGQGLGVLTGGANSAQGYIQSAINDSASYGQEARKRVADNLQMAQGNTLQSATTRGIGNTTITDTLQRGNAIDAERANQAIDEQQANRKSALDLNQANQANQSANSISGFIANRNDVGPNLGQYAGLVQGAAQGGAGTIKGSITNAPASYTGGLGGGGGGGSSYAPQSGGYQGGTGGGLSTGGGGGGSISGGGTALNGGSLNLANTQSGFQGANIPGLAQSAGPIAASQGAAQGMSAASATPPPAPSVPGSANKGDAAMTPERFFGLPPGSLIDDHMYAIFNKAMSAGQSANA